MKKLAPPQFLKQIGLRLEQLAAERPVLLAFLVFLAACLIVIPLSTPFYILDPVGFWESILAEAHGMLFDLLIIGWFLFWLNRMAERRLRNNRYREEIEDFLGWKSPEATHRIAGHIRRLNRGGVLEKMRLTEAFLKGANLGNASLIEADLWGANLTGANLREARLKGASLAGASLDGADLERADLTRADLRGASLKDADLERAILRETDLRGTMLSGADLQYAVLEKANLERTNLRGSNLRGTNLSDANLKGVDLEDANLRGANLSGTVLLDANFEGADCLGANFTGATLPEGEALTAVFGGARTLFGARFDPATAKALMKQHRNLFEIDDPNAAPLMAQEER